MKSRKSKQRKAVSIIMSTALLAYVDKAAKADNRSRSNYIEALLAKLARGREGNERPNHQWVCSGNLDRDGDYNQET